MTKHSAQHMFPLRPALRQGLFDLSDFFFFEDLKAHSLSHAGGSRSLSGLDGESQEGKSTSKLLLTWRNEGVFLFYFTQFRN